MSYKLNSPHNNDLIFQALLLVYGSALEILHFLSFAITLMLSHFVCLRRNISKYIHFSWRAKVTKSNRLEEAVYRVHGRLRGQLVKKKSGQSSQGENRGCLTHYSLLKGTHLIPQKLTQILVIWVVTAFTQSLESPTDELVSKIK